MVWFLQTGEKAPLNAERKASYLPLQGPDEKASAFGSGGRSSGDLFGKARSMKGSISAHMPRKSYSISAGGEVSMLTPLQMGRKELYDNLPFTATFGIQKKERSMSRAWASFAADLDMLQKDVGNEGFVQMDNVAPPKPGGEQEKRWLKTQKKVLDDLEMDSGVVTPPLMMAVFVATLTMFLSGYNTGVMNAPEKFVFPGHSTLLWSLAVASFAVGGPIGSAIAGVLADSRGRREALLLNMWTFFFGGMIMTMAPDIYTIIAARFIVGIAAGSATVLVPIYLGELAPPTLRGTLGTLTQFAMVIGILVSVLLAFPFAKEGNGWRYLFGVTPLVAFLQIVCAPFLLESPRWLLSKDPQSRKARSIIKKLRGLRLEYEVETEVELFLSATAVQTCETDTNVGTPTQQLFRDERVRHLAVASVILQMAQQLCGINAVMYYSTLFFDGVIDNPLVGSSIVMSVNVVATYVAMLLMDSCGRRDLILVSSVGMLASVIAIVLALKGVLSKMMALVAVNVYVAFFEIGLGPIPWLIVAEMFDAKYVSTAMSLSSQVNWSCNFIVGLCFPYLNEYLQEYSFVPFGVVLFLTILFAIFKLPETKDTTPHELQAQIVRKNSTAQFHNFDVDESYVNPVDMEWRIAMEQIRQEEEKAMEDGSYNYGFQPIQPS